MTRALLSFGHGYSAQALSRHLLPRGWHVMGTTRSQDKLATLEAEGVSPIQWPGGQPEDVQTALNRASFILVSAGPNDAGDPVLAQWRDQIAETADHVEWIGYLSTTGVYGDHQGGWVDETTQLTPSTKRGQARVEAEHQWQELAARVGLPLHIFRLAGIYGPGRGPFSKVRNGTARRILKPNQVFSRIHVEDIAQTLHASMRNQNPGAVYNLCDDDPAPPEDVIGYAAHLLNLPLTPAEDFETAEMTPMARSFYAESKRVRNDRIKQELGVTLKYPTYRDGLQALLAEENS
ncbi:MAG: SDR family oxidoreductase [Pseudoruegeria sp.]